ncbi:hypothetical protein [Neobacillus cucumis]|uniref:Uncharacterized protein n=1 Tax=Neobacillus cucumis TaxID=1740721 RepID=A0A2N5HSQ8_9BACI|nr:hypothetical protein [Neobacillus cucumis]PLS08551.1 hypothetical protein CVD27_03905 [Neobacillus cucumis]
MENTIETIYRLENPEKNIIKFATGSQLRYEDIIKEVFGVASVTDLHMMIQYNKNFQTSICKSYGIKNENKIPLNKIIRIASKSDLLDLKQQLVNERKQNPENNQEVKLDEKDNNVNRPFDTIIQLQEGIYQWDESNFSYNAVTNGA